MTQIQSAIGHQTKEFGVFLIALSEANSLLKEKEVYSCEKGQFTSLPLRLWNGLSRCFLSRNWPNKNLSTQTETFCRKILTLLSSPCPLGKCKQDFLASCWENFCQFYFLPEGRKTNLCKFSNGQQNWEEKGKAKCPGCMSVRSIATSAHWGKGEKREAGVLEAWSPKAYTKVYCWFDF